MLLTSPLSQVSVPAASTVFESSFSQTSVIEIDLGAILRNYKRLSERFSPAVLGSVVKANAYGLGALKIAETLMEAGCQNFFVATVEEAIDLRKHLGPDVQIAFMNGILRGMELETYAYKITPVLSDLTQVNLWREEANRQDKILPCILYLNTGLNRTGLSSKDLFVLKNSPSLLESFDIRLIMTHLASSKIPGSPFNQEQLTRFKEMVQSLPEAPVSIADSGSLILDSSFYGDLVRCAGGVFGVTPPTTALELSEPTFSIHARILQILDVEPGETIGYNQSYPITKSSRVATIGFGYADGYPRALSNRGFMAIQGCRVPVAGAVSMDLTTLDISDLDPTQVSVGDWVEVVGPNVPFKELMTLINSNGYEFLTHLGSRIHRIYKS